MNRKVIGIVLAGLLSLVGVVVLLGALGGSGDATADVDTGPVVHASEPIPRGSTGKAVTDRVEVLQVPLDNIARDAVTDISQLEGKESKVDIEAGQQMRTSYFGTEGTFSQVVSPVEVPPDLLLASIQLAPDRVIGGQIRPGDKVAILANIPEHEVIINGETFRRGAFTQTILRKVLVTNVQLEEVPTYENTISDEDTNLTLATDSQVTVTLALLDYQVEGLVFAYGVSQPGLYLAADPEAAVVSQTPPFGYGNLGVDAVDNGDPLINVGGSSDEEEEPAADDAQSEEDE